MTSSTQALLDKLNELEKLYDSTCKDVQGILDEAEKKTSDATAGEFDGLMRKADAVFDKVSKVGELKGSMAREVARRRELGI